MKSNHNETRKQIGVNIARYRKEQNLSQAQLAKQSHITRQHLSHIENSGYAVSLDVIFSIAKALCIPAANLFKF